MTGAAQRRIETSESCLWWTAAIAAYENISISSVMERPELSKVVQRCRAQDLINTDIAAMERLKNLT